MKVYGNRNYNEDKMLDALDRKRWYEAKLVTDGRCIESKKTLVWMSKELIERLHPIKS